MNEVTTYPPLTVGLPPRPENKWQREYCAFLRLLPELLKTRRGKYVAVHDEQVVDSGDDKVALALRAYELHGYVPIFVGLVAERPLPPERLPSFRAWEGQPKWTGEETPAS
jgi:hypothetical protein